jgi:hypothetical protein
MQQPPPLSVILPLRSGLEEIRPVLEALIPQALETGTEVIAVGPVSASPGEPVRVVTVLDPDLYRLRLAGLEAARGDVVAMGEDHAVPRSDWCAAVIRAHQERPEVQCVIGALANATDQTLNGRANFLSFAAPFEPPLRALPDRPPPTSAVTIKRGALSESLGRPGHFESILFPRLFEAGQVEADNRIVIDHYQDHGLGWSIVNAFHSARGSYGYATRELSVSERLGQARWSITNWPRRLFGEARLASTKKLDLTMVALMTTAAGVGGAVGSLMGPGRSPRKVA